MSETREQENIRNPDGTFKPGFSGNPGGRPKDTLKEYLRAKLSNMTPEEKELWLLDKKVSGDLQWQMAEGKPQQDVTSGGQPLQPLLVKFIDGTTEADNNGDTE